MTDIKEKILINLNSEDAIKNNGSFLSDVLFNFPLVLDQQKDILFVEGGVYNCSIPVSFYNINYSVNVLYYTYNSIVYNIVCPVGNYNFTSFASALTSQFLANGHIVAITINKITGIITFTFTGGTLDNFIESGSSMWSVLGFSTGSGNISPSPANTITPPYLLNLLGIKKIKIYSENFGIKSLDSKGLATENIIDSISVFEPAYNLLTHQNSDGTYSKINKRTINQIDIKIKDENSNYINFNNVNWTITLCLIIYRKINIESRSEDLIVEELTNIEGVLSDLSSKIDTIPFTPLALGRMPERQDIPLQPLQPENQLTQDDVNFQDQATDQELIDQQNALNEQAQQQVEVGDLDLLLYNN